MLGAFAGPASATISSTFDTPTGALAVSSNAGDSMEFACLSGTARVNGAAVSGNPSCSAVNSLVVNGGPQANGIILIGVDAANFPNATPITVNGNGDGDNITGGNQAETIDGGAGADSVFGGSGGDTLRTNDESGPDTLEGELGTDRIVIFGSAAQIVAVGPTEISISGSPSVVTFASIEEGQFDMPAGEPSVDLTNAPFPSTVNGGPGNDTVWTSPFNDILSLGTHGIADIAGAKVDGPNISINAGGISGDGVGNDTWSGVERASLISPSALGIPGAPVVNSNWDGTLANRPVEMQGGSGNDSFFGSTFPDTLGMPANPGGPEETGDDVFNGAGGADTIRPGPGTDTIRKFGVDTATATATVLTADAETDNYSAGGLEVIDLTGTGGADNLNASAFTGRVMFDGGAGPDQLTGSPGDDRLRGGGGSDSVAGGNGSDTAAAAATPAANVTVTPAQITDGPNTVAMTSMERVEVTGSSGPDFMDASTFSGTVLFDGAGGNDSLTGGLGPDTLLGGVGLDTLNAQGDNAADTTINCGAENDVANVDLADPATVDCETVNKPNQGGGNTGPGGRAGRAWRRRVARRTRAGRPRHGRQGGPPRAVRAPLHLPGQ